VSLPYQTPKCEQCMGDRMLSAVMVSFCTLSASCRAEGTDRLFHELGFGFQGQVPIGSGKLLLMVDIILCVPLWSCCLR